ncbi:MAG: Lrp/AsnC family transcriptional regulator [Nitrospinota bacterium]
MAIKISKLDLQIMKKLQRSLPMTKHPYKRIAEELGITEDELLCKIKEYGDKGYYRRFGATLRHQKAGFKANGMGIWSVPDPAKRESVGEILANRPEVSHAYERPAFHDWPYHIFTMIHATSVDEVKAIAKLMSEESKITKYDILFSSREFKKSSMQYFDLWNE